jgi:hypothetical protein
LGTGIDLLHVPYRGSTPAVGKAAARLALQSLCLPHRLQKGLDPQTTPSIGPCGSATGSRKTTAVLAQHHRPGDTRRLVGQCYGSDPRPIQHGSTDIGGIVLIALDVRLHVARIAAED